MKKFPKTKLHIVGGGEGNEERLSKLVKKLKIENMVKFHGFISDREKVSEAIRQFSVALAPYIATPGSARLYGDATKIRAYLAAGLPVITTHVPPLGKDAKKKGAAIIVNDNKHELAEAVIRIFSDKKLYDSLRKNAYAFAKDNTWEEEFSLAFKKMGGLKK